MIILVCLASSLVINGACGIADVLYHWTNQSCSRAGLIQWWYSDPSILCISFPYNTVYSTNYCLAHFSLLTLFFHHQSDSFFSSSVGYFSKQKWLEHTSLRFFEPMSHVSKWQLHCHWLYPNLEQLHCDWMCLKGSFTVIGCVYRVASLLLVGLGKHEDEHRVGRRWGRGC